MILSDFKGQVIMSDTYANAIVKALGTSAMNSQGQGGTFSADKIPDILANILPGFSAELIKTVHEGGDVPSEYTASVIKTLSGEDTGKDVTVDNTEKATKLLNTIIDFYYPIFTAAAANGWTTEYNNEMKANDDYISDAIQSGTFQLEKVDDYGTYEPDTSLTYFVTSGLVAENNSSEAREEVTAWYEAEKARISEKEDFLDIDIDNLSTELESINTEIQSIQSLIDEAISSVFDWGSS